MLVCIVMYVVLLVLGYLRWKKRLPRWMRGLEFGKLFLVLLLANSIAFFLFLQEAFISAEDLTRNSYGGGSKVEEYVVSVEGELEEEPVSIEIGEQEYSSSEIQKMFQEVMEKLDKAILGQNADRDHVEYDLQLVEAIEDYPVQIQWELDCYDVINAEGEIQEDKTEEDGTLVEVRGILSCGNEEAVYVTHVMVYPQKLTGKDKWLAAVKESVEKAESSTREQVTFSLPETIDGKTVKWSKKANLQGYYIILLGFVGCVLLVWKESLDKKEALQKRQAQMLRDYPGMISKFTLLLGTGMTVKAVWNKIVENYEAEKSYNGERAVYEEMCITSFEMKGGIAEAEAYERFGKRCGLAIYMKFGALLSQNLRKGSKGLTNLLEMEAIQAFENRKSMAKKLGEEASTKLLLPMFGMLAVVMVIVIIPAFLSIQL